MKRKASIRINDSIRISIIFAVVITLLMLCTSCDLLFLAVEKKYPRYTPSYAYQLLLEDVWNESRPYTEGKYLYLIEYENRGGVRLIKPDMETGAY